MLINGSPVREVARTFNIGQSAMSRHRLRCMGAQTSSQIIKQRAAGVMALATLPTADEANSAYANIATRIDAIADKAEKAGSLAVALMGLRELRTTVTAQTQLAGLIGSGAGVQVNTQVNVELGSAVRELAAIVGFKPSARALRKLESVADGE
jgi:hypothetical protein